MKLRTGFTLIECVVVALILAVVWESAASLSSPTPGSTTNRPIGMIRAYANAQAVYSTTYNTYGRLPDLAKVGLDSIITRANSYEGDNYGGYWLQDEFADVDLKHN